MFWVFFSLSTLLASYIYEKSPKGSKIYVLLILIVILSYVTGFGGLVGQDHNTYSLYYGKYTSLFDLNAYHIINSFTERGQLEPLYTLLMIACHTFGLGEAGYFFVVAFLTNYIMVKVFVKFKYPLFSVFLFIVSTHYFQEVNLVRQIFALSITFLGVSYLEEKKLRKFIVCIVCATFIHIASLVLIIFALPYYIEEKVKVDKRDKMENLLSFGLLGVWGLSLLVAFTGREFAAVNSFIGFALRGTAYEMYIEDRGVGMEGQLHYVYNIFVLFSLLANRKKYFYVWVMFITGSIIDNFAISIPNLTRMAYYFTISFFVMVPFLCDKNNYREKYSIIDALKILVVIYYVRELVFNHILNPDELLGTKMYNLTDFFK